MDFVLNLIINNGICNHSNIVQKISVFTFLFAKWQCKIQTRSEPRNPLAA